MSNRKTTRIKRLIAAGKFKTDAPSLRRDFLFSAWNASEIDTVPGLRKIILFGRGQLMSAAEFREKYMSEVAA